MTFDYQKKYKKLELTHNISVIQTDTKKTIFTGTPLEVSKFIDMPLLTVCGYAEWGRPAKKLKKFGYYLRWITKHQEE